MCLSMCRGNKRACVWYTKTSTTSSREIKQRVWQLGPNMIAASETYILYVCLCVYVHIVATLWEPFFRNGTLVGTNAWSPWVFSNFGWELGLGPRFEFRLVLGSD